MRIDRTSFNARRAREEKKTMVKVIDKQIMVMLLLTLKPIRKKTAPCDSGAVFFCIKCYNQAYGYRAFQTKH